MGAHDPRALPFEVLQVICVDHMPPTDRRRINKDTVAADADAPCVCCPNGCVGSEHDNLGRHINAVIMQYVNVLGFVSCQYHISGISNASRFWT